MAENTICEDWETGQIPLGFPAEMVILPDGTKLSDFITTVVLKALNLSDIQDKSLARTNLDVYSKSESNNIVPLASDLIAGKVKLINDLTSNIVDAAVTAAQAKILNDQFQVLNSKSFGVGQNWQDVTGIRFLNTTYTNNSGRTIFICIGSSGINALASVTINGVISITQNTGNNLAVTNNLCVPIQHGSTYKPTSNFTSFWEFK